MNTSGSQPVIRQRIIEYWRNQVAGLRVWPSIHYRLITGGNNQPLYDLLLVAGHELAHQFWETAANPEGQKICSKLLIDSIKDKHSKFGHGIDGH